MAMATSSSYPPPPPYYRLYKDHLEDPKSAPVPPPPIDDATYPLFGATYTTDVVLPSLEDQGVRQLYPKGPNIEGSRGAQYSDQNSDLDLQVTPSINWGYISELLISAIVPGGQKLVEVEEIASEMRVFPMRFGKFKNLGNIDGGASGNNVDGNASVRGTIRREEEESSSNSLDARRCYFMCSYEYVLGETNLQVSLCTGSSRIGNGKRVKGSRVGGSSTSNEILEGRGLVCYQR
ncbi:hypothetical protein COCNU_01G022690 [Cocos nucifera]|uniref:Mediator of RNA polymerase II transcription subunit 7 n=1 Tax=Cocos nucifera TaxID=13894 RepID=A0A8K0HXH0_COCNU|nr:hypothetical protein COCNU_01G022690 [Cocos nucifera]